MNTQAPSVVDLPVTRFGLGGLRAPEDTLTIEAPLEILINGAPFSVTMRTPGQELALVRGLLFTEGVLPTGRPFEATTTACHRGPWPRIVDLAVPEDELHLEGQERRLVSASSCGLCGKTSLGSLEDAVPAVGGRGSVTAQGVLAMQATMAAHQAAFKRSGGTHAAAAFDEAGQMLALAEDIGRHNAVDKVVGRLLLDDRLGDAVAMTVSGRISFEIVSKAARAQIATLIAVSAPSSLSVELADKSGMTLIGFCREARFNVYSHAHRVTGGDGGR